MHMNTSRTIAHLTDAHNTFRYTVTGEITRLINATSKLGKSKLGTF